MTTVGVCWNLHDHSKGLRELCYSFKNWEITEKFGVNHNYAMEKNGIEHDLGKTKFHHWKKHFGAFLILLWFW